jgi:GT2 family glycosyltransferase
MTEQMGKVGLVAIVVTFNRLEQLKQTLNRLLETDTRDLNAVLVLDNASTDGTAEWLAAQSDPRLHVQTSPHNLGGAGGFETAMRMTTDRFDPDWVVLMDDDARPLPGCLARFAQEPRDTHDAWAAAVHYPSGRLCDMNRPWINPFRSTRDLLRTLRRGRDAFHVTAAQCAETAPRRQIDGGSFVGLFLSRAAIAKGGYPDGKLFLYGDDVLYTLGLSQAGGQICFDPALRFEHDCETLSSESPVMTPLWKVYFFHRNQVLVYRRAAGPVLFWPVLALKALSWSRRARAYGSDAPAYRRLLRRALKDGLKGGTRPGLDAIKRLAERVS